MVTIGIKNSEDVITITEGESATVIVGLINFEARNYVRYAIALDVSTVDGTAIGITVITSTHTCHTHTYVLTQTHTHITHI